MAYNQIASSEIDEFIDATKKVFKNYSIIKKNKLVVKVNKDYPYIYTRDLSILIKFLIENEEKNLARKAIEFLLSCQLDNGEWVQRYDENSIRREDKLQEDNTPLALWSILTYIKIFDACRLYKDYKENILMGLEWIEKNQDENYNLLYSHSSNHEDGISEGFELWTNSVVNKIFSLAVEVVDSNKYSEIQKKIENAIYNYLVYDNRFIRKIDLQGKKYLEADIILLSPFYFEWLEPENELIKNSLKVIESNLYDRKLGGYWRYEDDVYFPGPWIIYSAVISRYYYSIGEQKKGDEILNWILKTGDNGELPEHLISKKQFYKYKDHQIKRAKEMPVEKMKKARINAIDKLEHKFENKKVAAYSQPILWSHIETARALKTGNYIDEINFS